MSNLPQVGINAVLNTADFTNGANAYMSTLGQVVTLTQQSTNVLNQFQAQTNQVGASLANLGRATQATVSPLAVVGDTAKDAGDKTKDAGDKAKDAGEGFNLMGVATSFVGNLLADLATNVINGVVGGLQNMAEAAFNATADWERLAFSMQALVAREIAQSGAAASVAEGMELAGGRAEELLRWIQQLAIKSPFDTEGVASAFRMQLAFGFVTREAQILTQALVDFAAANGRTEEQINRVSYALGQAHVQGKITGFTLKQLAMAGVDTGAILDKMGVSISDVRKGMVKADEFTQVLVDTLENDFGGAAQRQAGTLSGMVNSLQDLQKAALRLTIGPIFQAIQPYVQGFVDQLNGSLFAMEAIGRDLGSLTTFLIENSGAFLQAATTIAAFVGTILLVANIGPMVVGAIAAIGSAVAFLTSATGLMTIAILGLAAPLALMVSLFVFSFNDIEEETHGALTSFSNTMFADGYNLVIQFANGMAAAIGAIVDVLIAIGNVIASWLEPGSPPRLLPDIDTWGAEAMNEWLTGWTTADFSIFEDISSVLESFIRSLDIPETDVVPRIQAMRDAVQEAINVFEEVGTVSEETWQQILNAVGVADPAIAAYVQSMFELEVANRAVAQAQQELNDITERYNKLLEPINAELQDIANRRQDIIDAQRKEKLQKILADPRAPAQVKELARMELREIELKKQQRLLKQQETAEEKAARERLEAAKQQQAAAKEQMEAAKAQIKMQTESNRLMMEQIKLLERIANQAASHGGAGGGVNPADLDPSALLGNLNDLGGGGISAFGAKLDELRVNVEQFAKDFSAPFEELNGKFDKLSEVWGGIFGTIITKAGELKEWFRDHLPEAIDFVQQKLDEFGAAALKTPLGRLGEEWRSGVLQQRFSLMLQGLSLIFQGWVNRFNEGWNHAWTFLFTDLPNLIGGALTAISGVFAFIWRIISFHIGAIVELGGYLGEQIQIIASHIAQNVQTSYNEWTAGAVATLNQWSTDIGNVFAGISESITTWLNDRAVDWNTFWNVTVPESWNTFSTWITTSINGLLLQFSTWLLDLLTAAQTKWGEISTAIQAKWQEFVTAFNLAIETFKTTWSTFWTDVFTNVQTAWTDITTAINDAINGPTGILTIINQMITDILAIMTSPTFLTDVTNAAGNLMQTFADEVIRKSQDVRDAIVQAVEDAIQAAKDALGMHSPSRVFVQIGKGVMEGWGMGIEKNEKLVKDEIARAANGLSQFAKRMPPIMIDPPLMTQPPAGRKHPGYLGPPIAGGVRPLTDPPETIIGSKSGIMPQTQARPPRPQPEGGPIIQLQVGPNHISNGWDEAVFASKVKKVLQGAL